MLGTLPAARQPSRTHRRWLLAVGGFCTRLTRYEESDLTQQLSRAESDVAGGDLYAWTYDTIRRFKGAYHVEIANPGQPAPGDCDLLGNFPYKQIRFSLTGTGYYHDLGKFVADFENKFPHCRVLNLSMDPAGNTASPGERLNFRMDIAALVKPNN